MQKDSEKVSEITRQAGLYLIVSGLAALINFGSRFFYELLFSFGASVIFAYFTGMVVNFTLSKLYAFDSRASGKTYRELFKFIAVACGGLLVTYAVSTGALYALRFYLGDTRLETLKTLSHIAGMGAGFVANFGGHKALTFKSTGLWDRLNERMDVRKNDKT